MKIAIDLSIIEWGLSLTSCGAFNFDNGSVKNLLPACTYATRTKLAKKEKDRVTTQPGLADALQDTL